MATNHGLKTITISFRSFCLPLYSLELAFFFLNSSVMSCFDAIATFLIRLTVSLCDCLFVRYSGLKSSSILSVDYLILVSNVKPYTHVLANQVGGGRFTCGRSI